MDKMRDQYVAEMDRLRDAIGRTKSKYLKKDYGKALRKMERELRDYDRYKAEKPN